MGFFSSCIFFFSHVSVKFISIMLLVLTYSFRASIFHFVFSFIRPCAFRHNILPGSLWFISVFSFASVLFLVPSLKSPMLPSSGLLIVAGWLPFLLLVFSSFVSLVLDSVHSKNFVYDFYSNQPHYDSADFASMLVPFVAHLVLGLPFPVCADTNSSSFDMNLLDGSCMVQGGRMCIYLFHIFHLSSNLCRFLYVCICIVFRIYMNRSCSICNPYPCSYYLGFCPAFVCCLC